MFAKGKPRTPLVNSQAKFKNQLANNASQLNLSFPTAAQLVRKNNSQLRQTKLSVCQKDNKLKYDGFVEEMPKMRPKQEFVYVPAPKTLQKSSCELNAKKEEPKGLPSCPMSKPGRNLISLVGRVDFCLKTHKTYPDINAIWNVYGKLLRIIEGKRGEHTLLVRNENSGPILQGIYHDFESDLKSWNPGCFVHLVGQFIGDNRLQTFKIAQVSDIDWQKQFMRIENVTTYILMQNNVHK
ncbi:uncharacterized protein LOC128254233 [Drosophila gunungcola]|uniref:Uncharacterized protein n=1 Tax=Drosophila gunungcola TaxID=103775 RepID=A0A9P9YND4_9MUSC|nr:uncharacterized protein LOC128254233 [Drosophila gunungcola]KAI8040188.1 hypothetical protein M5D96_007619 [Drosophila gunungcola]